MRDPSAARRHEASAWATEYVVFDDPQLYPEVEDAAVWEALQALSGADLPATDREFLHGAEDFAAWREDLACPPGV
jgi:hypothetical protein